MSIMKKKYSQRNAYYSITWTLMSSKLLVNIYLARYILGLVVNCVYALLVLSLYRLHVKHVACIVINYSVHITCSLVSLLLPDLIEIILCATQILYFLINLK